MVSARRFASAEAVYASTAWSPEVSGSAGPRVGVEPHEIRAPMFRAGHDHGTAVRGPDVRARPLAAARGRLVAQHGAAHVEVVISREVLDLAVARHEQIR